MTIENTFTFFGAVIAWDVMCLQLLIIPFLRKAETLQKDYITSGVLDAARSFVETKKLIPALAKMFVRIRDAQGDRRLRLGEDELQEILQQIDYIPNLELTQEAMEENNKLEGLFDSLQNATRYTWGLGLFHVIVMLCLPASQWMPVGYNLIAVITAVILAVISFMLAIYAFVKFDKKMKHFLELLKRNR